MIRIFLQIKTFNYRLYYYLKKGNNSITYYTNYIHTIIELDPFKQIKREKMDGENKGVNTIYYVSL